MLKILYVEDNDDNVFVMRGRLSRAGFEVVVAADGEQGVAMAETEAPNHKVDRDGFQVAHKMLMFQWQDGKKVILWPEELAAGKPRFPTPPWSQR